MSSTTERKLAAIMFTDIAGYTAQMSKDEAKAMELLKEKESILKPLLEEYKGTFVKSIGDGTLTYFESAINAASCAVRLQELTYDQEDLNIRAGIHIGDIVFKDDDVFGDGVNISARLESMAPVGGVCVSKNVYDELMNQKGFEGVDLGLQSLKGVGRLVEVYGLKGSKLKEPKPEDYKDTKVSVHKDDEVPSIAVIPFDNKGADEDVFYAYGISADLIRDLTQLGIIKVSSINDIDKIENYNQKKAIELAEHLEVRYIVQGSLWRMNDVFQLNVDLYDSKESNVKWSDRWQEKWEDLPNIKTKLCSELSKILNKISNQYSGGAMVNSEAYKIYLQGKYLCDNPKNKSDIDKGIDLYKEALEKDNGLLDAMLAIAWARMRYDYEESMEYNEKLKCYLDENPEHERFNFFLTRYYSYKGWIYQEKIAKYNGTHKDKKDFKPARNEFKKALNISKENDLKKLERDQLHNIARTYMRDESYEKHDEFAFKSLAVTELLSDIEPDMTWANLAHSYILQKKYDLAKKYLDLALAPLLKNQFQMGLMHIYSLYVKYYFDFSGDLKSGHEFFDKFEKIAINMEHWGYYAGICSHLSEYYKRNNDIEKSNYYNDLKIKYVEKRDNRNKINN